jgi:hypothetical protein
MSSSDQLSGKKNRTSQRKQADASIMNVSSITAFWQLLAENLQNRFSDVV